METLTAARSWSAAAIVVVAAALLTLVPLPARYPHNYPAVPGLVVAPSTPVPAGWGLVAEQQYPWASRYLGPGAMLTREMIRADYGVPAWDKESRRRRIMVDTTTADRASIVDNMPELVLYRLRLPRVSPPETVVLGGGIVARINTVLDDRRLLSWTWLSWNWSGRNGVQRVTLIAADNHLPTAEFPEPQPSFSGILGTVVNQLLRGNAVVLDTESRAVNADFDYKDRDMLTTVAREIVQERLP